METFPRPDIAEGIFYEYLRYDDPIAPELLDRVVDGFPFLLGPVAKARGIGQTAASQTESASDQALAMWNAMTEFKDIFVLQAMDFADAVKRSAVDAAEHAGNAAKAFGLTAKEFAFEADRRRDLMVKHTVEAAVAAPTTLMKLMERDEATISSIMRWWSGEAPEPEVSEEEEETPRFSSRRLGRGCIFGYSLSRWFGEDYYAPDEIGPMKIHPTVNKIFLTLVHLYLLLLFIVSFPGSNSIRTKHISRKSRYAGHDLSDDSESDISEDNDRLSLAVSIESRHNDAYGLRHFPISPSMQRRNEKSPITTMTHPESGFKKKSLSYFL
jgi:hypothetical protein